MMIWLPYQDGESRSRREARVDAGDHDLCPDLLLDLFSDLDPNSDLRDLSLLDQLWHLHHYHLRIAGESPDP